MRIRCHLRRYLHLSPPSPAALKVGGITLDDDARAVTVNDKPVSLTPLEYDILKFLMQHPCKVFSPQEIYRQVWRSLPPPKTPWQSISATSGRRSRWTPAIPAM